MRHLLCTTLLVLAALIACAQETVPPEVARAVRDVIQAQLNAFQRDAAAGAFAHATPGIRATFGSAENFMDMVKKGYAVVYRPKSVAFEAPILVDGKLLQPVRMTDAEGRNWVALYPMQKQPDGQWRTKGCRLFRLAGTTT